MAEKAEGFVNWEDPYLNRSTGYPDEEEQGVGVSDYAKAIGRGAVSAFVETPLTLGSQALRAVGANKTSLFLDTLSDVAGETAKENLTDTMSAEAKKRAGAAFAFPEEGQASVWDAPVSSIGLKAAGALPSLIASAFPAMRAAKLFGAGVGALVGGSVAGGMTAAEVYQDIKEEVQKLPDAKLREQNDMYRELRSMGIEEAEARAQVVHTLASYKPIIVGALSALTSGAFGIENLVAKTASKEVAKKGFVKGGAEGLLHETAQEASDSFSSKYASESALAEGNISPFEWRKVIEATIEGGIVGGVLGGGTGAITNIGGGKPKAEPKPTVQQTDAGPLDATLEVALAPTEPPAPPAGTPVTPGVTPPGPGGGAAQQAPTAPAPKDPRGLQYYTTQLTDALGKLNITLSPDEADELTSRVREVLTTIPGSQGARRSQALKDIRADFATRLTPPPAAPATPAPNQDQAAIIEGLKVLDQNTPPKPEPQSVLGKQVEMLVNGERDAVFIPASTPEAERPRKPVGFKSVPVKGGIIYYNKGALTEGKILKASREGRLNDILPYGPTTNVQAAADVVQGAQPRMVQTIKDGIPVAEAVSSTKTVEQDAAAMAAQAPADAQIVVRDSVDQPLAERDAARQAEQAPKVGPKTGRILEAVTNKENQKALNKQVAENLKKATQPKKAPRTFKGNKEKAKREADNAAAKELFAKWVPENPTYPQTEADRQALLDRLNGILNEANERGIAILDKVLGETVSGELAYLTEARALRNELMAKKKKVTDERILTFLGRELGIKKGEVDEVKSERRSEGEMANRQDQGDVEAKADTSDDALSPEAAIIAKEEAEEAAPQRDEQEVAATARERKTIFDEAKEANLETRQDRIRKLRALMNDPGATPGERAAAREAIKRVEEGASEEVITKLLNDLFTPVANKEGTFKKETRPKFEGGRPKVEGKVTLKPRAPQNEAKASRRRANRPFASVTRDSTFDDSPKKARVMERDGVIFDTWESRRNALRPVVNGTEAQRDAIGEIYNGVSDILLKLDSKTSSEDTEQLNKLLDLVSDVANGRTPFVTFVDDFVRGSYGIASRHHLKLMELVPSLNKLVPQAAKDVGQRMVEAMSSYLESNSNIEPDIKAQLQNTIDAYEAGRLTPYNIYREAFLGLTSQEREQVPVEKTLYNLRVEFSQIEENETAGLRLQLPDYQTGKPVVADVFHGTGKKIKEFAKEFLGAFTGAASAKEAFFFARNPATSNNYARKSSGGKPSDSHLFSTLTGLSDFGKLSEPEPARKWVQDHLAMMDDAQRAEFDRMIDEFHMNNRKFMLKGEDTELFEAIVAHLESAEGSGPNVIMGRVYMENPLVVDQNGERYRETKYYDAIMQAKKEGRDGVIFLNTFDGGPQDVVYAVFSNDQISQRFNPERAANQAFPARAKQADLTKELGFDEAAWFEEQSNAWDAMSPSQQAKYNDDILEFLIEREQALIAERLNNFDRLTPEQQSITMADFRLQEALTRNPNLFDDANLEAEIKRGNYVMPDGSVVRASESGSIRAYKSAMIDFDEIKNPVLREVTKFIWKQIEKRIGGMQVMAFTRDQIDRMFPSREPGEVAGFYNRFGSTDFIVLDRDQLNDPNYVTSTLIHEAIHGMTVLGLDTNIQFFNSLKAIADQVRATMAGKTEADLFAGGDPTVNLLNEYGFEDMYEFVAEAFGNPLFQKMLAQTTLTPELAKQLGLKSGMVRTLWDAIVNTVRQLLNMPPNMHTALEGVLRVTERATRAQTSVAPDQKFKERGYYPKFQSSSAAARAAQGFADAIKGTAPSSIAQRKTVLALSTLDQIRQWYRGTFVNEKGQDVLENLIANIQRIRPFADDKREGGERVAQRFIDFARTNPEAANEFAEIANTVTMLNAQLFGDNKHWGGNRRDSWQARALLPDLQRRFAAMTQKAPEAAKLYTDMVSYYRTMQNEITRQLVDNILAEHNQALSEADRASLTTKVMEGTLDDAARKLLNNNTIFNALKDARQLRLIEGDYFPLMRHGDFVVQTRDSVGDLHGGVEVEPGVIEFTGNTESDALKKAESFAKRETKGAGFTKEDGVPLVLSGPTAVEMPSDSNQFKFRIKVQLDGVHMFDTQAEAESFIKAEKGKFAQISSSPLSKRDDGNFGGEFSNSSLAAIANSISARDDIPQVQRQMMLTALKQAAVRHMAGNRVQKRSLPRRGFVGASNDLARNTLVYAEAATRYLGKLKYMPLVREAFSQMQKIVDGAKYSNDHQMLDQVLQHMRKRVDGNVIGEQEASPFVRDLLTMSSIDKLASPAYSLIQTLQPTMMTLPYLSGRYGIGDAGAALARAYSTIGAGGAIAGGLRNTKMAVTQFAKTALDSTDVLGSILANVAKEEDGKQLTQVLNELIERGILDKNAGIEVAEVITKGRGKWAMGLSKVDRITRQLPAAIEQVNRAVSAIAAYRLAVAKGDSHEKAMSRAFDTVVNTQGDYSASNAPDVFNHPIWRISLQFKKYAQMYYAMFGDMLYRAFKDASPEERAVARRQLAHVVAVQILGAGALGVPGMELIKIAAMAAGALGIGGGYDDFEREVRKSLVDMTGSKTAGELIAKGVLPRAIGIDLSSRLGADSLLTFGEPKKYDETNAGAYLFNTFVGAPGSLIMDQFKAARGFADAIREGDSSQAWKSAELLPLPKVIADTAKAARKAYEGQTSGKSGRQTEEPIGLGTAAINAFGLRTADQAEKGAAKGAQISQREKEREDKSSMSKLKNQFAEAKNEGERVRILARLKELNAKLPEDQRETPAQFKAFAKKYQADKAKGLVTGGARFRNDAERRASEEAGSIYNYAR